MIGNRRPRKEPQHGRETSVMEQRLARLVRSTWYRQTHLGGDEAQPEAIEDFLRRGRFEMCDPNPLFDGWWYRETHGLTDVAEPVLHYLEIGASLGLDPGPAFDTGWYLRHVGEVPHGVSPLEHFLTEGRTSGIDPHPLFSTSWYLEQMADGLGGLTPLEHFLSSGWRLGHDPCALFSTEGYVRRNPDVAASGINPLLHYLKHGVVEGREGTKLWVDADYRRWFSDDVLVQRLGAIGHFRTVAAPMGRSIDQSPVTDRVGQFRIRLEEASSRWIRLNDDGDGELGMDWNARRSAISLPTTAQPDVTLALFGTPQELIRSVETLSLSEDIAWCEVIVYPTSGAEFSLPGVEAVTGPVDPNFIDVVRAALPAARGSMVMILPAAVDAAPGSIRALRERLSSDASIGLVGGMHIDADLGLVEVGRRTIDGSMVPLGRGDSPGRWMYGVAREVESCSMDGAIVHRELLERWSASFGAHPDRDPGESLAEFVRQGGGRVIVDPEGIFVRRNGVVAPASVELPPVECQLRNREVVERRHVVVLGPHLSNSEDLADGGRVGVILRSLRDSGSQVHFLTADGIRVQPATMRLERMGIEVVDAPMSSGEIAGFCESLHDRLDLVVLVDPISATRWLSFLLERLPGIPIVYDAIGRDTRTVDHRFDDAAVARIADLVVVESELHARALERKARRSLTTVVDGSSAPGDATGFPVERILEVVASGRSTDTES